MKNREEQGRKNRDPIPPQEDLYADYYRSEDPFPEGGAHLSPEDRERYYAQRDAYYARRDAYYAQRDAYYAQREAEEAEDEEEYEEERPARPRRRTAREDYAPEDRSPRRRSRRRARRALRRTVLLLLFAGLVLLLLGTPPVRNAEGAPREAGHSTILLCGTDAGGMRTDTIMLLSLERGGPLRLLSIPRDTYVPYYTSYKINAVYGAAGGGEAGMERLMEEVGKLLGFAPDGYVLVDMDAVVRAVDILGGVDYDVPQDMSEGIDVSLSAGPQHLDGEQVLSLLRYRQGYATADIGRTAVQRDFIRAALDQWLTPSHLRQLPELLSLYGENMSSDLSLRNLMWIARVLVKSHWKEMVTQVLPGWADMVEGSSVYMLDKSAAAEMVNDYDPYI